MSLINDMLSNLEQRDDSASASSSVFAGLKSAESVSEPEPSRAGRLFFLLSIPALIGAGLYYVMFGLPVDLPGQPQSATKPAPEVAAVEPAAAEKQTEAETSSPSLKLDESLLNSRIEQTLATLPRMADASDTTVFPIPEDTPTAIQLEDIRIGKRNDKLHMEMHFSGRTDYRSYFLTQPDRLVFDIQTAELDQPTEKLSLPGYIEKVRHGRYGEQLRMVFDLEAPLEIVDEQWLHDEEGSLLTVQLREENSTAGVEKVASAETNAKDKPSKPAETQGETSPVVNPRSISIKSGDERRSQISASDYQKALQHYKRQDYGKAMSLLEKHLAEAPNDVAAHKLKAMILVAEQKPEQAMRALAVTIERLPEASALKQLYAQLLMQAGQPEQAVSVLSDEPPSLRRMPDYHALLAALLQQLGEHDKSAALYKRLVQVEPERGVWWLGLAISLDKMQRSEDALAAYRKAQERNLSNDLRRYVAARINALSGARNS
ncbi:tetratricopeptide (TPR) repeat protein [Methylohalomonas lacus]|uniref:Tetratricopeptide (TPR) repeat protein n=1 Tax=Methylohalomonas lacus TaxID=398773 RepID=A0AAE3L243_9GAMM|nr:tetratricopeptide repeat protein [Methylohalomonas lacus]MCS3904480.1 tetratricopeptide (TPR) repeat protein [Methylohalomonas lacus]